MSDINKNTPSEAAPDDAAKLVQALAPEPTEWNLENLPPELDYFRTSEAYQVELTGFQGPMDLLLHLIDKEQVDIYDIPIARITDQFIKHIEVMQTVSLDEAGEFIALAATLMVIKMKMLMPNHGLEEEEDEEDPRAELVRKLLEYKRFKEAAESMQRQEMTRQQYHMRQTRFPYTEDLDLEPKLRIEMFDLLSALAGIFDRVQASTSHDIEREPFTVDEKIALIVHRITTSNSVTFEELFSDDKIKMEVIVTFIAILEMVKRGRLQFLQTEALGPIWIQKPAETPTGTEAEIIETVDDPDTSVDDTDTNVDDTDTNVDDTDTSVDDTDTSEALNELETES